MTSFSEKSNVFVYSREIPVAATCEVLVVGAGPAGVSAAVSAARAGADVILCERFGVVGGMLTSGHVDPILGEVSRGTIYDEIVDRLHSRRGEVRESVTHNGREIAYDPEAAKSVLSAMLREAGVRVRLCSAFCDAIVADGRVEGAIFATQRGLEAIKAKITVDATGDGCVAAAAGCEVLIGRESDGALQPSTIEFTVEGVDETKGIFVWGGSDSVKVPGGPYAGMEYRELCKLKNREGELPPNVTIVRLHKSSHDGERSVNATQANGYDPLDPGSLSLAESELRAQIDSCVAFLRKYIPGFENCRVKSSASTVGVRESRRIRGIGSVVDADVEQGRKHTDAVVHNAWFLIDIHNPNGGGQAEGFAKAAKPYDIPYGALVPAGVGGILTSGRCISGTHRAHASYRVMAICMATGEAAGAAAALCAGLGIAPAELPAEKVRQLLASRGIEL